MAKIDTFEFHKERLGELKVYPYGTNWPVVYVLRGEQEIYIGETTNLYNRSKQHFENSERNRLGQMCVITDEQFNRSAANDIEALLIQYVAADNKLKLQNRNGGQINHNYYQQEMYKGKLATLWPELKKFKIVEQDQETLNNSDFFKYSPYKALTEEQSAIVKRLLRELPLEKTNSFVVHGGPGTGKSIVALNLLKRLREDEKTAHLNTALVVPMEGLRRTYQKIVKRIPHLGPQSVIGPNDVATQFYDILIVDEAHRLRRRVNLGLAFGAFDKTTSKLELPKESTQLDWILRQSKQQVLFYDERQTVLPGDIRAEEIKKLKAKRLELISQMRVEGGEDYLGFIDDLLSLKAPRTFDKPYDFKFVTDIKDLVAKIAEKDKNSSLARLVAGYAWPWSTKGGKDGHDIEIDGIKLRWNSMDAKDAKTNGWIYSENAPNEVGCIHTVQGYDLNYTGVIVGPELRYDKETNELYVDKEKYKDTNGKNSIAHPDELKQYVLNIYRTILTRGIKGTYVYIFDEALREKWYELAPGFIDKESPFVTRGIPSPYIREVVSVPLVGSAPCGAPLFGEENIEEYVEVEKSKIKPGFNYFILRAKGDSMDLADINDGDLVLCRQQLKGETGDRVVALLGGENVTIKMYGPRESGVRLLLPRSTNKAHTPITPGEGDSVQGVVQEVLE